MNSDYIYNNVLTKEQKIEIHLLIAKGKSLYKICKKYKLSKRFIKYKHQELYKQSIPISFRGKTQSYYDDEMKYGSLILKYEYNKKLEDERPKR